MRRSCVAGLMVAVMVAVLAFPVFALEEFKFDKSKLFIGAEFSQETKDIDEVTLGSLQVGKFLGVDLTTALSDFEVTTELLKVGYEVSESAKPYVLIGLAQIDMEQQLNGSVKLGGFGIGATLLQTDIDESDLAYGVGIGGDLAQYKGIVLGYDVRYLITGVDSKGDNLSVLPQYTGITLDNAVDVDYRELDLALILSKTFAMDKVVKSLTPSVGYRYSYTTVNVSNKPDLGFIGLQSETNYKNQGNDLLLGLGAQINENVSVNVAAVIGDNNGGSVSVGYSF